jgi:2-polyprenyl-3-methyl-5-hydroxy-6-metoxy-1,4-benzoquinol methylase
MPHDVAPKSNAKIGLNVEFAILDGSTALFIGYGLYNLGYVLNMTVIVEKLKNNVEKPIEDYAASPLTFTGERFLPSARGELWSEHWHRYHYVLPFVAGKVVLDCASGEGYGTVLMAAQAAYVTGVDVSYEAVHHARSTYAGVSNCAYLQASATALPVADSSVDVVVSFETIEHVDAQAQLQFMTEIARVLKPDGLLIMSSPNKAEYTDKRHFDNTFHVREMYADEFAALLMPHFPHQFWLGQKNQFVSRIEPMQLEKPATQSFSSESITVSQAAPAIVAASLPPIYYVVLCAKSAQIIADAAALVRVSSFTDSEEWAYNDYASAYRELNVNRVRLRELEAENAALKLQLVNAPPAPLASKESGFFSQLFASTKQK